MEKPKKSAAASGVPGKKKVIRRLVKNAKTGEIIKTEIVRIDSSGEKTVTSYPAGTPVPSLSSLQSQSSSQPKKTRKPSTESKSPARRQSREENLAPNDQISSQLQTEQKPSNIYDEMPEKAKTARADIGPSVPANVPGLEDLIKKEEEMRRMSESNLDKHEKIKPKDGEESLETALISIMKRKRQRNPKVKRGLVASTMPRRQSDDDVDRALDDAYADDTDYRSMPSSKRDDNQEDEEAERKRKERHRRRREKKQKERSQADHADFEEYEGETGPLDLPDIESYRKRVDEEVPMELGEEKKPPLDEETEISNQLEGTTLKQEPEDVEDKAEKEDDDSESSDDKKKKKKKHKHKKKKKKNKKQKKRESRSGSEKEGKDDIKRKSRTRSRSRSLSSLSLSSISSTFSDGFDFAGMDFDPSEEGGFDMALMEYQQMRGQFMGPFPGRGYDPFFFRGRGNFRGFPRGRGFPGGFPGAWRGRGFFPFFPGDPNFVPFPGGPMPDGTDGGRGRGSRAMPVEQGPWRGRGLKGRGVPPGFHRNYTEDDQGGTVYVAESSGSSDSNGDKKKKKKKHRRRSYSSRSYSSSGSSRSRSRSRRRHRRRHRSSSYSSRSSRSSYSSRSRSYSRSYSRSSRSYSSYSRSSYSRSRSRSSNRSGSKAGSKALGYNSEEQSGRASPSYRRYDEDGFKPPIRDRHSDEEEVPWWAEFDKTYEVEKKKLEEEKKKLEEEERAVTGQAPPSIVSTDEIDVVSCVMNLVDKTRSQQDDNLESARECINDMIVKISSAPVQATQLHEEMEDPFDKVINDCVDSILDRVTPNDPKTAARLCLKEIIDTVVEQEEEDKANEEATEMEKEITESEQSRLFQCYIRAQKLTEQIKAERRAKGLTDDTLDKNQNDEKQKSDDRRRDKKGYRSRHRRRSRSRSRDRGRRRRRRSSSDRSRSSSRSSDHSIVPLVSKESLQQAQAVLLMQQQQLQVAGLLGTGMPNLAGLTEAAALAAGITPALLEQTARRNKDSQSKEASMEELQKEQAKFTKWDKDKEVMSKTKSKDELTRKLMQRMKEKKMQQEEGDMSPTFQARLKEKGVEVTADKVFSGPMNLKSRKIAISSSFGKLWSKVEGSPRNDENSQDGEIKGYNKSDIVAASSELKDQLQNTEKLKAEEQEKKLAAWSDQQAKLKEEAKREMRQQIERAERAKKEQMKEEMLEQERQKEIMRIREEVRNQIRKEIEEEIEKQRKTVLEDPSMREKLLELEALRSQSGRIGGPEGMATPASSAVSSVAPVSSPATIMRPGMQPRDQRWFQQQMKNKQDMQKWMVSHGYYESEMDEATMKRMQMTYMQNWTMVQKQAYMQWYWQNKNQPGPGFYPPRQQQHPRMQRPTGASQDFPNQNAGRINQEMQHHGGPQGMPHDNQMQYQGHGGAPSAHPHARSSLPGLMDRPVRPPQRYEQLQQSQPTTQNREAERQTFDYNHERRIPTRDQYHWQREQESTMGQNNQPVQQQMAQTIQQQPDQINKPVPEQQPIKTQTENEYVEELIEGNAEDETTPPKHANRVPWWTEECETQLRLKRGIERKWKKYRNDVWSAQLKKQKLVVRNTVKEAKQQYFKNAIVPPPVAPNMQMPGVSNIQAPGFTNEPTQGVLNQSPPVNNQPIQGNNNNIQQIITNRPQHVTINQPAAGTMGIPPQVHQHQPPLHQYPPPGMEEEERPIVAQIKPVHDQPPPPGESMDSANNPSALRQSAIDNLRPPGEELNVVGDRPADDDSPNKKKKKKQKKHRKHKKKRYSSSEDEDEATAKDPESEKAAILAKLKYLQDVEDGEIASDDAAALAAHEDKESKRKKKHRKERKRHKKRKDDSSDEEVAPQVQQQPVVATGLPPPPVPFYPQPGMSRPPFDQNPQYPGSENRPGIPPHSNTGGFGGIPTSHAGHQYPPHSRNSPHFMMMQDRERQQGFMSHPRDHGGSGEPQHMMGHPEHHKPPMGPGGDHNPPQIKRSPSPLPLVIPTDPHEYELWQQKMSAKYNDGTQGQKGSASKPDVSVDRQLLNDIETIRRRQGEKDSHGNNDDMLMMMQMMEEEEQRRQRPPPAGHDRPPLDGRKRSHGRMARGRKRSRRHMQRKNYHDWDKPDNDGLIYCMSGSDSSGWGSDTNMDFDRMLAKKRRETGQDGRENVPRQRSPPPQHQPPRMDMEMRRNRSPGHMMGGWDRRDLPPRNEDMMQGMEKPQGIPVIGGGPRPIPTNVSSNRPTPPHRHPEVLGHGHGMEFLPPDIIKMPPQYSGYPPDPHGYPPDPHMMGQRRDPGIPPGMSLAAHPIPRLGGPGAPPMPPMMMNPQLQQMQPGRMHPADYRPRYGM